jgi:ribonuclease G
MRDVRDMAGGALTIRVNPDIADLLHGEENHIIVALEREVGRQIVVYPNHDFHLEEFDIFESVRTP